MNLANMLLARGANRRKELAIRLAIGASRFRSGPADDEPKVFCSRCWAASQDSRSRMASSVLNSKFTPPTVLPVEPNVHSGLARSRFRCSSSRIVCGIGFSLAPALRATKADLTPALKDGPALQWAGYRRFGLRNLLMVAQVAGSLMLLLMTGFLVMGISKDKQHPNQIRSAHDGICCPSIRCGTATRPKKRKLYSRSFPNGSKPPARCAASHWRRKPPFSIQDDEDGAIQLTAEDSRGVLARSAYRRSQETVGAGYFAALSESIARWPGVRGAAISGATADAIEDFARCAERECGARFFRKWECDRASASGTTSGPMKWSAWCAT